jgi:tetratricopeptide (TPR) repeat protein
MLARSEKLALADTSGNRENRAAVLAMIAEQHQSLGSSGRAVELLGRALALIGESPQSELRSQLVCQQAFLTAAPGRTDLALRIISHELEQLHSDPRSAAECLLYRAYISENSGDTATGLRDARQALETLRQATQVPITTVALFLGALGHSYQLNGQNRQADEYFERSLREYTYVGRDRSPDALVVRSNWALVSGAAGTPKRAVALYDEALAIVEERDPGGSPPAYMIHNRARSLQLVGRFAESQAAFELGEQLAVRQENHELQGYCLLGLAGVAADLHDTTAAATYLQKFALLPGTVTGEEGPLWPAQLLVRGKLHIEDGRFDAALLDFDRALHGSSGPSAFTARLGKAEAELLAGNATGATSDAQVALELAASLQGGLPYSNRTGLAWLMLGRALRKSGDPVRAQAAFESATRNLANTVDTGHPALLEARRST